MGRSNGINEDDSMLNEKKIPLEGKEPPKIANKTDVAKAINKSNKKHAKMMKMLAE